MTLPEYQELSSEWSLMETVKENDEKCWVKHAEARQKYNDTLKRGVENRAQLSRAPDPLPPTPTWWQLVELVNAHLVYTLPIIAHHHWVSSSPLKLLTARKCCMFTYSHSPPRTPVQWLRCCTEATRTMSQLTEKLDCKVCFHNLFVTFGNSHVHVKQLMWGNDSLFRQL